MSDSNQVQQLYAERASLYERLFVDFLGWQKQLKAFFQQSDYVHPNSKVLDAGCGTGVITRVLYDIAQERDYQDNVFHAFDLTQAMLDVFQQWIISISAQNIALKQADVLDINALPGDWNNYNLIVSSTMLEYLPRNKVKDALVNLKQLLTQDGILLIFLTKRNLITRLLAALWWKTNLYNKREIETALHDAGFKIIQFRAFSAMWASSIMVIQAKS